MALWTPAEITTELWLDASDASTITIATGVSQWDDKSGNGYHFTQATASAQPALSTAALNGLDVITFDGINDFLRNTSSSLAQPINIFVVAQTNVISGTTGSRQYVFDGVTTNTNRNLLALRGNQTNNPSIWAFLGWLPHTVATTNTYELYTCGFAGASSFIGVNGVDVTGNPGTNNLTSGITLGTNYLLNADWLSGGIAELVITTGDVDITEGYLAWKWGLEGDLPVGHPYKTAAPIVSTGGELLDFTSTGGIILGGTSIISYFVGPIGKFLLSNPPIPGLFLGSRALFVSPTRDYEDGGIKQNNPSSGHLYQRWRCRIFGDYVVLDAEEVLPQVIFVGAELTECSIAFDQNMRPTLVVVEAGQAKLQWFDSSVGEQVITFLDPDVVTPRVTLDDKRPGQISNSDIILAYVRLGGLYYRQQSDRFLIEYFLDAGPHTGINKIGMNKHFRLQFSMMGVAP
jgi:hypothetical protein